jgi:predicted lipid-binding transport protein (Tim44 family)
MPVDLIVLAAVAVFVLLRLYGVLGKDIGLDKPSMRDATFDQNSKVIELTPQQLERNNPSVAAEEEAEEGVPDAIADGVKAIRAEDNGFRLKAFMEGAKVAFEMVLEGFAKEDVDTLKHLLSKELYEAFLKELKQRKSQDEFTETTLISILEAEPKYIVVDGKKATVTVRFVSEQIQVSRTKTGETVKDSTSAIEQVEDEWVFVRDVRSSNSNPNWVIVAT